MAIVMCAVKKLPSTKA
ncbi:hypothetical protein AB3S75_026301 [Citrus x aurantiifolia]